ncbi:Hsp70 family protein [Nocardia canadensis]|uniref:hypothetical protein n=1 Tax=Nocardia canadensis TaxID=3065238 RepID=UPI00292F3087|nr:hypothetical protein [Nocardia canadensis]
MVLVLGVSAGAGGARAVLTHSDQPHLPPVDRLRLPRRAGGSVDEAVLSVIRRMRVAALARGECVTATAVTCRSESHADAIRAAVGKSEVGIVDEPLAQLRYLRFTGMLPDSDSVILYDLGCSGLTVTHADCRTDTILASRRSTVLSGDGYDALLRWQLARGGVLADARTTREHRESLSRARVVTATDADTGGRAVVTRSDLAELCEAGLHHSASFVRQVVEETGMRPGALVLLGGCTRNPSLRADLAHRIGLPIVYDPEPDYVSARGAVLLAAQRPARLRMPRLRPGSAVVTREAQPRPGRRKLLAAMAVTATLGGTVAGLLGTDDSSARSPEPGTAPTTAQLTDGSLRLRQN